MPVQVKVELCSLCGADLSNRRRDGLEIVVGYSTGGWGRRSDMIKFSDEVCNECFEIATKRLKTLWTEFKEERKNANKTFVVVTDPVGRTEVR